MSRATAELIESGQAQHARKAGDSAPEFTLTDPDGKPVASRELLAQGPLVISFYRGVWCPYCNLELQALQEALAGDLGTRRQPGCDLAANGSQQPQIAARQQARLSRS